jgi:hypothetical protein
MNTNSFLQPTLTGLPDLGVDFSEFVNTTDNQVVGGKKTFTTAISQTVPATGATDLIRKQEFDTAIAGFVDTTTNQTIVSGVKIFTECPQSLADPVGLNDLTNAEWVGGNFVNLNQVQTINLTKTFTSCPLSTAAPVNANDLTNKNYVDTNFMNLSTAQAASGVKTFNVCPRTLFGPINATDITRKDYVDTNFVSVAGTQNITGAKTYTVALPQSSLVPTLGAQLTNKTYVDGNFVTLVGPQNVGGTKVFTVRPQVTGGLAVASSADLVNREYTDLTYVSLTAANSISGIKTFTTLPETSISATTGDQLTNKTYVDSAIVTGTSGAVLLTGDQTLTTGIKTFNVLPESSVTASTSNQLTNLTTVNSLISTAVSPLVTTANTNQSIDGTKTFTNPIVSSTVVTTNFQVPNKLYVDNAITTAGANYVTLTGNQTISNIKTFNALPECSVSATTANQLVNRTTLLSYVPDSLAMTSTSEITGPTVLAYPPLVDTTTFYAISGVIANPSSPGTPTSPFVTQQQVGFIQITGNDYDTIRINVTINRQVYNANSGTITFNGITGDVVRVADITNPMTPILIIASSINVSQTASLVFGAAPTPVATRATVSFTVSGAATALGRIYGVYWEAAGINISGGTVGVRFDTPISTSTDTIIPYDPVGLTGRLMANYIGANVFRSRMTAGVWLVNSGTTIDFALYTSVPNLTIPTNQVNTGAGAIPTSEWQIAGLTPTSAQNWLNPTPLTNFAFHRINPGYGVVNYVGINYTGAVVNNYKNNTNQPAFVNLAGNKQSIRIYFQDVELL